MNQIDSLQQEWQASEIRYFLGKPQIKVDDEKGIIIEQYPPITPLKPLNENIRVIEEQSFTESPSEKKKSYEEDKSAIEELSEIQHKFVLENVEKSATSLKVFDAEFLSPHYQFLELDQSEKDHFKQRVLKLFNEKVEQIKQNCKLKSLVG